MTKNKSLTAIEKATNYAGLQMAYFVEYLMKLDKRLTRAEASALAGEIIRNLPSFFESSPSSMVSLRNGINIVIENRNAQRN